MTLASVDDDGILLPRAVERQWVFDALNALFARTDFRPFVVAPILTPEPEWFPDPWSADLAGAKRLLRRLMHYVDAVTQTGWANAPLELKLYANNEVSGPLAPAGAGALVWWVSAHGGTLQFAARADALRDPSQLVPAAARAVCEAWRQRQKLAVAGDRDEQKLIDLTTVHLGFGLLTTDARIRYGTTRSATQLGVLPPQVLAFALASQCLARGLTRAQRRDLGRRLQPNQRAFLDAALHHLERTGFTHAALAIPGREDWGPAPERVALLAALPHELAQSEASSPDPDPHEHGVLGSNRGRPVFRVHRSKALRLARSLGLPVFLLGVLATQMPHGVDIPMAKVAILAAALALCGLVIGRFLPDSRCSEPRCATPLPADATTCPRCEGNIVGVIAHPRERLAAEEAWLARTPSALEDTSRP